MEIKYSKCVENLRSSEIRNMMSVVVRPDMISFAGGMPGNTLFPIKEVEDLYNKLTPEIKQAAYQYGPTGGYPPLLNSIKDYMQKKGMQVEKNRIIITTGALQAIDILAKILIDPGDSIIVEYPTFIGALASFNAHLAKLIPVPMDADGMLPDELEKALDTKPAPKMVYISPYFHNPAGIIYSKKRKETLLKILKGREIILLEDDCYGELYFNDQDAELCVPMKTLEPETPHICYMSSFSKIMGPGLRIGWMVGHPEIIGKAEVAKQSMDACTSTYTQVLANEFLASGKLFEYVKWVRGEYKKRAKAMVESLNAFMPPEVHWVNPRGGFYMWLQLPEEVDATEILKSSLQDGAVFISGKTFDPEGKRNNCMRLAFSNTPEELIPKGVEIVAKAIKKFL
ncbi:MAG: PLP-dependent aminotransferase family protein [Ignavibacteriaceae bacterium]